MAGGLVLELKHQSIRGLKTGWLEGGNPLGPIFLFLHGFPDTPQMFSYQFSHFADRYHIIAPYTRGAKPSENSRSLKRFGQKSVALDHLAILKKVDPDNKKSVIIMGHDLGTVQAWRLAPLLGKQLQGMVIINGMAMAQMLTRLRTDRVQIGRSWYMSFFILGGPVTDALLKRFPSRFLQLVHQKSRLATNDRPRLLDGLPGVLHPVRQYRALATEIPVALGERHIRLKAPVLVLWGKNDPYLAPPKAAEMTAFAEKFTIRILEGGHWIHRESPDEVNLLVEEFLCPS